MSNPPDQSPPSVIKSQKYTVTIDQMSDGKTHMHRCSDSFNPLELLGLASLLQKEICDQIRGELPPPDRIVREVVVPPPSPPL